MTGFPNSEGAAIPEAAIIKPIVWPNLELSPNPLGIPETDEAYSSLEAERKAIEINLKRDTGRDIFETFNKIKVYRDVSCLVSMYAAFYKDLSLASQDLTTEPGKEKFNQFKKDTDFLNEVINMGDEFSLDRLIQMKNQKNDASKTEQKSEISIPVWVDDKFLKREDFQVTPQSLPIMLTIMSSIAHDFKAPLTRIFNYMQFIEHDMQMNNSFLPADLINIDRGIKILAILQKRYGLIFHDGQFEPIQLSLIHPFFLVINFNKQIMETQLANTLADKGINVKVLADMEQLEKSSIEIDQERVASLLTNCVINVMEEKTKKGVDIKNIVFIVRPTTDGKYIDVFVMDDGDGFPESADFVNSQTNSGIPKIGMTTKQDKGGEGKGLGENAELAKKFGCEVTIHNGSKEPLPEGLTRQETLKGGIVRMRFPTI